MVSPCRTCKYIGRSKNHPDCIACRVRQQSFDGLVRMEAPVAEKNAFTKVCVDPNCPHGTEPQPLENFQRNAKSPDGRLYTCKSCMSFKIANGRRNKKALAQKPTYPYIPEAPADKGQQGPRSFEVDLSGHPELFDHIRDPAVKELRTVDNQVVYMLMQQIERMRPPTWA